MTLLKTKEYIDLVELTKFMYENYGWPASGETDSFHSVFCDAVYDFDNGSMTFIEFGDHSVDWYEENYSPPYAKVVEVFRRLIADGYLPERSKFEVYIWW